MSFDHNKIEAKWRKKWRESGLYKVDLKGAKKPFYNLMMFPYPSAEGLHVGNMYAFTGADFYGRFQAMRGQEVFEPMGLDGFGIHSENYAIKIGAHPSQQAKVSQKRFYDQLSRIGNRFSWEQRLETYDPEYYKWTQWLFIKMFEKGLAVRKKSMVNWCPSCKTVLADEQVEGGVCERCKTPTVRKETYQWFFKITDYADRLLGNIDKIDWPQKIKTAQRNWIGRKEGINITYEIKGSKKTVTCFTTTPVNFGATFIVIAPEHVLVKESKNKKIQEYVTKALKKTEQQRQMEGKEKTGVFTGLYAVNHVTKKEIPIWVADFVLKDVGTGAVQGCPGHDLRDFEFAKKFGLPITRVVVGPDGDRNEITRKEQVIQSGTSGKMVNSDFLNGMEFSKAMQKTMDYFEERGWGERVISFHLRDWLISRQRYWGPPIPMIFCDKCEWQPVPEKDLPVELPFVKDYQPLGEGKAPLEKAPKEWLEVKCPNCGGKARRETDVSDTFLDSSWYFLRYPSIKSNKDSLPGTGKTVLREKLPWDQEVTRRWLPVNAYIGGAEHAVLHLLYSRFVWMCLRDWGYLPKSLGDEPFPFLYSHGLLIKDGAKMSKSRGNVVIPDEYMEKFGTDALRMYLMFIGPYDQGGDFQDTGMMGMRKFLDRVWRLVIAIQDTPGVKNSATPGVSEVGRFRHQTVKRVTQAMENLRYNVGIAALMEYVNFLEFHLRLLTPGVKNSSTPGVVVEAVETLVLLLAPMAPFISEEMWQMLRKSEARSTKFESVHQQAWPTFDEEKARADKVEVVVQVNGKLRARLSLGRDEAQDKEQVFKAAKSEAAVKRYLENKKPVKEIFVKGKLVNLVVR